MTPRIAPKTAAKINGSHPEGTRHQAKIDIALPLLGDGLPPSAVIATLTATFPAATEREIREVVEWCASKNPTPSGYANGSAPRQRNGNHVPHHNHCQQIKTPPAPSMTPREAAEKLVGNAKAPEADWLAASPVPIPEDPALHAALLIRTLYAENEFVCGHWKYGTGADGRIYPCGPGVIRSRQVWLDRIEAKGMPFDQAGCWWRMNPLAATGSGTNGAPTDADVTAFRFALVEHDKFTIDEQLALLARFYQLSLPIAAIILSGGKSVHAWVKLDAKDAEDYAAKIEQLLTVTGVLGYDTNKNPSRLGRAAGVKRTLGATGDGWQRLLYLNPSPASFDFARFEAGCIPVKGLISGTELIERVGEWMKPRKADFTVDFLGGTTPDNGFYFRPAEVTLWTGVTSHGKTTMLSQVMMELCMANIRFFVSSLEHKAEQLCEVFSRMAYARPPTAVEAVTFLQTFGERFHFADTVGEIDADELFRLMRASWLRHGSAHFFIDSLMRVSGLEEDYPRQLDFVNRLQAFAKETGGHIHLVAHPRKLDETSRVRKMDVKGSSAIPNNADNIIAVRRNVQKQEADEEGKPVAGLHDAEVSVEKQRATGWQGVMKLAFDPNSRRFSKFHSHRIAASEKRKWND